MALHKLMKSINITHTTKTCICLICNYISKIEHYLQSEFINISFNNLPNNDVFDLLKIIIKKEQCSSIYENRQNEFQIGLMDVVALKVPFALKLLEGGYSVVIR